MKILFIAGREPAYVRNAMLLKCLEKSGHDIIDCTDSSATYPARFLKVILKFLAQKNFDCVCVGFLGQPLVPIIRKLTSKPVIFDAFLSTYDTMCFDRRRFTPDSLAGKFFFWLDRYSCTQANRILLDTDAHIEYFTKTFGLPGTTFNRVFVGADESLFYPREVKREDTKFRVFYYSSFLPLHGTEYIVQAAGRLREQKEIEFVVVGKGMMHSKVLSLAQSLGVDNIRFIDWIPYEQLPLEISRADVCLGGHFSDIDKAKRVIAGKTFQFIAMKKPVIVGDCPGNREIFIDRQNAVMVRMADAVSLADAILELSDNAALREKIAEEGYKVFIKKCNTAAIGRALAGIFNNSTS
ncbi:MAG: glycosyl transferase family 1 [Geobacter sp.]|nr:MAG: glycosyl transferase family 1 [Geobacter sp.]